MLGNFSHFCCCQLTLFFQDSSIIIVGWGKTGLAHPFPPPLLSNLSIYLSVFWFKLLLHCIWTLMIDLSQWEIQASRAPNCRHTIWFRLQATFPAHPGVKANFFLYSKCYLNNLHIVTIFFLKKKQEHYQCQTVWIQIKAVSPDLGPNCM